MKKNNLILGTFLSIAAILFSSCGASPSSDNPYNLPESIAVETIGGASPSSDTTSIEKVEGRTESIESIAVVTIGSQIWTSKNLNVSTYRNGDVIPQVQDPNAWANLTTGAWCYYNNDASNDTICGKLYNWYAVNDPRGLAPKGFHIPSDAEWTVLTNYLGGEEIAGKKMKSTSGWKEDGNKRNSSGFSGHPGGSRGKSGSFRNFGGYGYWWSSTEDDSTNAWNHNLYYCNGIVYRSNDYKESGLSVRCLRD